MILRTLSKGQKGLRQSCPNKGFNNYTDTYQNTLYTHTDKIHKNTQDMPQNEINCILIKLISTDCGSVWWFCTVLQFCPENSKKKSTISNCTIRKHQFFFVLLIL